MYHNNNKIQSQVNRMKTSFRNVTVLFGAIFFLSASVEAQKIYSTKSGKITFQSIAPLEDIEATNSEVESKLSSGDGQIILNLLMKGFHFENQLMEDHFNENYVESSKFPKSTFKGIVTNIKEVNFGKDGTYPVVAKGQLTLHGVTKDVQPNGTITIKNGHATAKSKFSILLKDYNVAIPKMAGKKIAQNVTILVDCQYQ
jgi:hypothetical protein